MIEMKPLYLQLSDQLIKEIKSLGNPQKFLSEREICRQYDVSRTTVRAALNHLEHLGYISRQHGKGTFTSSAWRDYPKLSMGYSFSEQMQSLGKKPTSQILGFGQVVADDHLSKELEVEPYAPLWYLYRSRLADDEPMMLEMTYLPVSHFPNLSAQDIEEHSLYHLFETQYNQRIQFADEIFMADLLTQEQAKLLGVKAGDACLSLTRKAYNQDRLIIEYTSSVARHDCFFYQVRHYNNR
ncbi:GntR family transcriptional regulator [Streptococcus rupicaprae]|uniref:GntR family transcriptional regulator n=1 Tax=Streptococcus rupicaprae TaxID=759619 RepID=A0ABV2FGQ0_9STRE